jgi:hypothetical protein
MVCWTALTNVTVRAAPAAGGFEAAEEELDADGTGRLETATTEDGADAGAVTVVAVAGWLDSATPVGDAWC